MDEELEKFEQALESLELGGFDAAQRECLKNILSGMMSDQFCNANREAFFPGKTNFSYSKAIDLFIADGCLSK